MKKRLIIVLTVLMMFFTNLSVAWAASGSVAVSISSASTTVGSKVTVKVTVKCANGIGGAKMRLEYDSKYLKLSSHNAGNNFSSGSNLFMFDASQATSDSYTFTFYAKTVTSSTSIKISTLEFIDFKNGDDVSGYKDEISKTLAIEAKTSNNTSTTTKLSSDASLSKLEVENMSFEEGEFDPDKTQYTIYAGYGITSLNIKAVKSSSKATLQSINSEVKEGWNKIDVNCVAENGTKKAYTLNVYVEEKPEIYYSLNDKEYGVVKNLDKVTTSDEAFVKQNIEVNGKTLEAFVKNQYVLLYLADENQQKDFYLYDKENDKITGVYSTVTIGDKLFVKTDVDYTLFEQLNELFVPETVVIDEQSLTGWGYVDTTMADFKLVYLKDELGKAQLYRYDSVDKTIQRYAEPVIEEDTSWQKYLTGSLLSNFVLLIITIILAIKLAGKQKKNL